MGRNNCQWFYFTTKEKTYNRSYRIIELLIFNLNYIYISWEYYNNYDKSYKNGHYAYCTSFRLKQTILFFSLKYYIYLVFNEEHLLFLFYVKNMILIFN